MNYLSIFTALSVLMLAFSQPPPFGSNWGQNQWNQNGRFPNQSGQFPNQNGQNGNNQNGQFPNQNGQFPNQNGQFPNQNGQNGNNGQFPNQNGQFPNQNGQNGNNGQFPNQNGQFPNQNGQNGSNGQFPNQNGQFPNQNGQNGNNGQFPNQNGQFPNQNGQNGNNGQFPNQNGQFPNQNSQNGNNGQFPNQNGQFGNNNQNGRPNGNGNNNGPANRCTADMNSATLPECMNKYFINGELRDGNNATCNTNKGTISAKLDLNSLFAKAEALIKSGTCTAEQQGRGRKKRQGMQQTCGTGTGVGNCETSTSRLQSVYGEKDLGDKILIVTNGVPDHCYRDGADQVIPNYVCEHYRYLLVPKVCAKSNTYQSHQMGAIGITISGAFLYNHLSAESSCNAAAITEKQTFDTCDGHADPGCHYHYHKAPNCIRGFNNCSRMGYSKDGIAVYGKCSLVVNGVSVPMKSCYKKIDGKNGCDASHYQFISSTPGCNLDMANGYTFTQDTYSNGVFFKAGTYAYFFTPDYPFAMPGYYGNCQAKWCVVTL